MKKKKWMCLCINIENTHAYRDIPSVPKMWHEARIMRDKVWDRTNYSAVIDLVSQDCLLHHAEVAQHTRHTTQHYIRQHAHRNSDG